MKFIIFILIFLLSYENASYQFVCLKNGDIENIYDLNIFNIANNDNIFYSGPIKNIKNILNIKNISKEEKNVTIKEGNYPLVFINDNLNVQYFNLFPTTTIFIILKNLVKNIKDKCQNYNIFSNNENYGLGSSDYVKIGIRTGPEMTTILKIIILLSIIISFFISIILRIIQKKCSRGIHLPINFLIFITSDLLFITNVCNGGFFFLYEDEIPLYLNSNLFLNSFYKCFLFGIILFILSGWMTFFFKWKKKLNLLIMLIILTYRMLSSLLIFSDYYELDLIYIQDILEYSLLLCFIIYCVFKKLIPLRKHLNYAQRINLYLVECIKFKYKKFFSSILIITIYNILFFIFFIFDYKYISPYIDNINIHFTFQFFYDTIFLLLFAIVHYPKRLPRYFFYKIIFNIKEGRLFIMNNISKENSNINSKKLNISNLTFDKLKSFTKKDNIPIVLLNPYPSEKNNSLFNEIQIGIVQKES